MYQVQVLCWVLFLLHSVCSKMQFRCDYLHDESSGLWYKVHIVPEPWLDANLRCQFEGATLASPTKRQWPLMVARMAELGVREMFTGLSALTSRGTYETVNGMSINHPSIVSEWAAGEPNDHDNLQRCISVSGAGGRLADVRCEMALPYMCAIADAHALPWNRDCGTTDSEYRLFNGTGTCYKVHSVPREFSTAHAVCTSEGGRLALPIGDADTEHVRALIAAEIAAKLQGERESMAAPIGTDPRHYFVGFHDTWYKKGLWRTVAGEPGRAWWASNRSGSVRGAHCAALDAAGELQPLECDVERGFVCEKKPDSLDCDHLQHPRNH